MARVLVKLKKLNKWLINIKKLSNITLASLEIMKAIHQLLNLFCPKLPLEIQTFW